MQIILTAPRGDFGVALAQALVDAGASILALTPHAPAYGLLDVGEGRMEVVEGDLLLPSTRAQLAAKARTHAPVDAVVFISPLQAEGATTEQVEAQLDLLWRCRKPLAAGASVWALPPGRHLLGPLAASDRRRPDPYEAAAHAARLGRLGALAMQLGLCVRSHRPLIEPQSGPLEAYLATERAAADTAELIRGRGRATGRRPLLGMVGR